MILLIVVFLFGSLLAFFATQNTDGVTINYLGYAWADIPVYLVVIGSILAGLMIAGVLSFVNSLTNTFTLMGKDKKINETSREVSDLKKKISELEAENKTLSKTSGEVV